MSIKKSSFGSVEDVIIIEFGKGTLSVVNGHTDEYKCLLVKEKEHTPIGEIEDFKSNSDDFNPQIAIIFHNRESFDVFKEYVNKIESEFNSGFENEILKLINWHISNGLSKADLVRHMEYITKSCKLS